MGAANTVAAAHAGASKVSSMTANRVLNRLSTPPPRTPHSQKASPSGSSPRQNRRRAFTAAARTLSA